MNAYCNVYIPRHLLFSVQVALFRAFPKSLFQVLSMIDPLSATSAAASFIGLAGQAAQGIAFILSVIDDFRDAPRLIINLKTKLQVLEDTLTILSGEQPVKVNLQAKKCITEAVEQCWSQIVSLRKLIERNDFSSIQGATKRRWKQFLAGSNKAHFQK